MDLNKYEPLPLKGYTVPKKRENYLFRLVRLGLKQLRRIQRFSGKEMKTQDNVAFHTRRMYCLILFLEKKLKNDLDITYLKLICLAHDIPEIETGDLPSPDKQNLEDNVKKKLISQEREFLLRVRELIKNKIVLQGEKFKDIVEDLLNKKTKEAKFLKLLDVIDAMMICVREIKKLNLNFYSVFLTYLIKENKYSIFNYIENNNDLIMKSDFLLSLTNIRFLNELKNEVEGFVEEIKIESKVDLRRYIFEKKRIEINKKILPIYNIWEKINRKYRIQTHKDFNDVFNSLCPEE